MLATIVRIKDICPIPNADAIEAVNVLGWWVVCSKKENFKINDLVIYIGLDSIVPTNRPWCSFMEKSHWKVKTIKLRGQLSQGLIINFDTLTPEEQEKILCFSTSGLLEEDIDVTEILGVTKYEKPLPNGIKNTKIEGNFPSDIPKTNEERIQNVYHKYQDILALKYYLITEKLDGTSITIGYDKEKEETFVCSRNWIVKNENENIYWKITIEQKLDKIAELNQDLIFQGELIGPGIQENPYKLEKHHIRIFKIFDRETASYMTPYEFLQTCMLFDIQHVPIVAAAIHLDKTLDELLDLANGFSAMNELEEIPREGLVCSVYDQKDLLRSFKIVSNDYLLKNKE